MRSSDFDSLAAEVLSNTGARVAYLENNLRRRIVARLQELGITSSPELEKFLAITQLRRAFGQERGGNLNLSTLIAVADAAGFEISVSISRKESSNAHHAHSE